MKYILLLLLLNIFNCIAAQPMSAIENQAVYIVKKMFNQIIDKKLIYRTDEEYYFGDKGGILGESLYSSLNSYFSKNVICVQKDVSPIGILLHYKLYNILKDKKRFSFAFSSSVYTVDRENVSRTGVNATFILFVRAIPSTKDKYFNDISNGVNFIFAINYKSNKKDFLYIDLVNSYINGIPFYKILGFYGNYASGLKLPENEIKKIFEL